MDFMYSWWWLTLMGVLFVGLVGFYIFTKMKKDD